MRVPKYKIQKVLLRGLAQNQRSARVASTHDLSSETVVIKPQCLHRRHFCVLHIGKQKRCCEDQFASPPCTRHWHMHAEL